MALRIKVKSKEFEAACTDGFVFGLYGAKRSIYVYAELGQEKSYISQPTDDPNTNYRIFFDCDVYFAKTREQRSAGQFETRIFNCTVIIYC